MMKNTIEWCGAGDDSDYGFYREGGKQWRADIAHPGAGGDPRSPDYIIYVNLTEVGRRRFMPDARSFLDRFFDHGLHKRHSPFPQTPAAVSPETGEARQAGQKRGGR